MNELQILQHSGYLKYRIFGEKSKTEDDMLFSKSSFIECSKWGTIRQYVFRSKHICGKTIGRAKDEGKIQNIGCLCKRVRGYDKKEHPGGF